MTFRHRPRVLYVVFNEAIWSGPPYTQATLLLCELGHNRGVEARLLAFLPMWNMFVNRQQIAAVLQLLTQAGIQASLVPIPFLFSRYFHIRWFLVPFFLSMVIPVLVALTLAGSFDIIHARGYPAGLAALLVYALTGRAFIFDPRSPFPEENVVAGNWSTTSPNYAMWKAIERLLLERAAGTVATTRELAVSWGALVGGACNAVVIPNNVDTDCFRPDENARAAVRRELGISEGETILVYEGSMKDWNNPDTYASLVVALRALTIPHRFLFVIPPGRDRQRLLRALNTHSVSPDEYVVIHSTPQLVPKYLAGADVGLQIMTIPDARLSVKFVEYLAAGLPVWVNSNLPGAARFVRELSLGVVLEPTAEDLFENLLVLIQRRSAVGARCRRVAERTFSTGVVADQYAELYAGLTKPGHLGV